MGKLSNGKLYIHHITIMLARNPPPWPGTSVARVINLLPSNIPRRSSTMTDVPKKLSGFNIIEWTKEPQRGRGHYVSWVPGEPGNPGLLMSVVPISSSGRQPTQSKKPATWLPSAFSPFLWPFFGVAMLQPGDGFPCCWPSRVFS